MKTLAEVEQETVMAAIAACDGHVITAAEGLGIGTTTLYRRLKDWGVLATYSRKPLVHLAAPLSAIKQSRFMLLPTTSEEMAAADWNCPKCGTKLLLPNGAHQ